MIVRRGRLHVVRGSASHDPLWYGRDDLTPLDVWNRMTFGLSPEPEILPPEILPPEILPGWISEVAVAVQHNAHVMDYWSWRLDRLSAKVSSPVSSGQLGRTGHG